MLQRYERQLLDEAVTLPIEKGDILLGGKFKNKRYVYDHSYINDKGDVIFVMDNGKEVPAMKVRLMRENLTLSDVKANLATSDFTKDWIEIRRKLVGAGNRSSKIKSIKVNKKAGYVTFTFKSFPSYFDKSVEVVSPDSLEFSRKAKFYTEEIRFLDFFKWAETKPGYKEKELTNKEVREILNACDIQYFCNCGSFQFQGMNYAASMENASLHPESRFPSRWVQYHNGDNYACKHLSMIFNSMGLWLTNMTSMINKILKK